MTTKKHPEKSDSSASVHKPAAAQKATSAAAAGQSFDIIPRSRVRPDTNSRPVITANKPQVADNTLTMPSGAPELHIRRRNLTLKPSEAFAGVEGGAAPELESHDAPQQQGVSVADLIAKKQKASEADRPVVSDTPATPGVSASSPPTVVERITSHGPHQVGELTLTPPSIADKTDATPVAEPALPDAETNEEVPVAVAADAATPAADNATSGSMPQTTENNPVQTSPDISKEAPAATEGSLEQALQDDGQSSKPQTQNQAFKDALTELDDKDDESEHHELYGGKPVIVIHKEGGMKTALMWLLWFVVCLAVALLIIDLLLDAGVISTGYDIPHTEFFNSNDL